MFRCAIAAVRIVRPFAFHHCNAARVNHNGRTFSTMNNFFQIPSTFGLSQKFLMKNKQIMDVSNKMVPTQVRTVTKFSLKKGKRKTVKAAIRRFYRLDWGGWIRPKIGRHKKLWKKSQAQKRRLRQHVLCNATQSTMLDKMVTKFWKRPKYYVDDPYAPYHTREEFPITRRKPIVRS